MSNDKKQRILAAQSLNEMNLEDIYKGRNTSTSIVILAQISFTTCYLMDFWVILLSNIVNNTCRTACTKHVIKNVRKRLVNIST